MTGVPPELAEARRSIDDLDAVLVQVLAKRFAITRRVGQLKAELALPAADPVREAQQRRRVRQLAEEAGLDPEFAERVLTLIVTEVVRHHEQARQEESLAHRAD